MTVTTTTRTHSIELSRTRCAVVRSLPAQRVRLRRSGPTTTESFEVGGRYALSGATVAAIIIIVLIVTGLL